MTSKELAEANVLNRLIKVIEDLLQSYRAKDLREKPKIEATTDLYDDLQIDSLEIMDLMSSIENEFKVKIKSEDLTDKRKVKDIVVYIMELSGKK